MSLVGVWRRTWAFLSAAAIGAVAYVWFALRAPATSKLELASTNLDYTWDPIISIPWITYGGDFGGVPAWQVSGVHNDGQIDHWFNRLEQDGVAAVAWFLFGDGRGALSFDPSGYVRGVVPSFWHDYRSVLAAAERHRLKVVWILTDFEIGMPIKVERGWKTFGRADLLEDPLKRKSLIREALAPILTDKNGSRQIAGWIVINEPEHLLRAGYVTEDAIRAFVTEAAAEIKRFHPDQRVGLANTDLASMIQFADLKSLDFLVFHHYGAELPPPASFVQEYLRGRLNGAGRPRPIFIGEFNWNFPPGLDLNRFVLLCREFGYAGIWPWSLRNRLNETGSAGSDTDPQFTLLDSYATSIKAIRRHQADNFSRKAVRQWAVTELKTLLESQVQRRVMILDAVGASHNREAQENQAWAIRCQRELSKASRELDSAREQARRAQADVDENERWASRALPAEVHNSRAGVESSREWRDKIDGQIRSLQVEIENQQHDFATATERARMHTYLSREASAELTWLRFLAKRLTDPTAVSGSIDINW